MFNLKQIEIFRPHGRSYFLGYEGTTSHAFTTHSLAAMLTNPLLKKEVWKILHSSYYIIMLI